MRVVFNSHSVKTLKKEISKTNIKGYSKLNKNELVNLMMKHKDRFSHIEMNKPKKIKETKKRKPIKLVTFN